MMVQTGESYVCTRCGMDSENPEDCPICNESHCLHTNLNSLIVHCDFDLIVIVVECSKCRKKWICDSK